MKDNLFWYKFQPKSLKNIVLLKRNRDIIEDGLKLNMIFYSESAGTGKSTLAKILCADADYIEFNSSKESSVDILRNEVDRFCRTLNPFNKNSQKVVFFDEFDGVSKQFQKALKGVSDTYQHVRFILTTNYIQDIDDKILSRFNKIDFTPKNQEEIDYLSDMYFKYLMAINNRMKVNLTKDELKKIIAVNFPDLRSAVQKLNEISITQNKSDLQNITTSGYKDIFDFLTTGHNNVQENWHFVMDNFQDKPLDLMKTLGRPFFSYFMENNGNVKKSAMILNLQRNYNAEYEHTIDPIIHLISYITDIKDVLKNE
jgi:DNA polymerase III delta prime subunit